MSTSNTTSASIIATVEAKVSDMNPAELIANYEWCLVLGLPRECKAGKSYRFRLQEIKKDKRGKPLYRAIPAPVEYADRWRLNASGQLERFTLATNWLLQESDEGIVETRAPTKRDGTPRSEVTAEVVFGSSLATSVVRVSTKTLVPEYEEVVENGELKERHMRDRDAGTVVQNHALDTVYGLGSNNWSVDWWNNRLIVDYNRQPALQLRMQATYQGGQSVEVPIADWSSFPVWLQDMVASPYPICVCSRERVDTTAGHSVCALCRKEAEQLELIEQHLPLARRQEFARLAKLCCDAESCGGAVAGEQGASLVIMLTKHKTPQQLEGWKGYPWYYFTPEGIFASRLPPTAMMILSHLDKAQERGLITLVSWLSHSHKNQEIANDFYELTQVRGEVVRPEVSEWWLCQASAAINLRGSEAARQTALSAEQEATALGLSYVHDAHMALHVEHDYKKAAQLFCVAVAERQNKELGGKRLQELMQAEYSTCPCCHNPLWENKRGEFFCSCLQDAHIPPQEEECILKYSAVAGQRCVEVVLDITGRIQRRVLCEALPETPAPVTTTLWIPTDQQRHAWRELHAAQQSMREFEREAQRAEGDDATRVKITWDQQLSQGRLFALVQVKGFRLETVEGYTERFTGMVRFICDPARCKWLAEKGFEPPRPGETWYCSWQRVAYGSAPKMIGRDNKGRPIIVANPQLPDDESVKKMREAALAKAQRQATVSSPVPVQLGALLGKFGKS